MQPFGSRPTKNNREPKQKRRFFSSRSSKGAFDVKPEPAPNTKEQKELRNIYLALIRKYHPDKHPECPENPQNKSIAQKINQTRDEIEAYIQSDIFELSIYQKKIDKFKKIGASPDPDEENAAKTTTALECNKK